MAVLTEGDQPQVSAFRFVIHAVREGEPFVVVSEWLENLPTTMTDKAFRMRGSALIAALDAHVGIAVYLHDEVLGCLRDSWVKSSPAYRA